MGWRGRSYARWHVVTSLVKKYDLAGIGVELGVKEGRFSAWLLEQCPTLYMFGVDLCQPRQQRDRLGYETYDDWDWDDILREQKENMAAVSDRFELIVSDTVKAADKFEDQSVDFVFIDAEHTYEGVSGDILAWRRKIRPGGILCGHDYNPNKDRFAGVVKAVDEIGPITTEPDSVWWKRCN